MTEDDFTLLQSEIAQLRRRAEDAERALLAAEAHMLNAQIALEAGGAGGSKAAVAEDLKRYRAAIQTARAAIAEGAE